MTFASRAATTAAILLLATTGCDRSHLADDIDFDLDFATLEIGDELHTPYVEGAQVVISAVDTEEKGLVFESSDASVLRIDSQSDNRANCTATGAGVATLTARTAGGEVLEGAEVRVMQPTHVELRPHGFALVHMPQVDDAPVVLAGGMATFEVKYFAGPIALHGNGALTVATDGTLSATPQQTVFFERREWLQIQSDSTGTKSVRLTVGSREVSTIEVEVVGPDAVDSVALFHEMNALPEDDDDKEGEEVTVLAQAFDAKARPVYGVEYSWDLDGDGQPGLGDLFRYVSQPGNKKVLGAEFNGKRSEILVETSGGVVDSSNRLGCSTAPGRATAMAPWAIAAALAALLRARRRADRRRPQ